MAFPINLFLLLSSPRKGKYSGKILVVNQRTDKALRYVKFVAEFHEDNELLPLYVDIGDAFSPKPAGMTLKSIFPLPVVAKP